MKNDNINQGYILRIAAVATLGGLLFGYDTGVISNAQVYFTEYFDFNDDQQGLAVSSALFGCLFGALVAGFIASRFSRKYALIFSALLFSISAWGSGIPESLAELVFYRIIGGFGVGIASLAAPMYIAEIAPAKDRGRLVTYYQLAIVIGFFVVFLATYFIGGAHLDLSPEKLIENHQKNVDEGWRMMFWSELIPALSFFLLLFFVPHSPRWLIMKGRINEAKQVLHKTIGQLADAEVTAIQQSLDKEAQAVRTSVFAKGMGKILLIGMGLSILQQVTGINAILYYGTEIFKNALGYGAEQALAQQLVLGAVNLVFTFVAIALVDSWGRKPLLITGTIGMMLGIGTLGTSIYFEQLGMISLIGMLTFIASFALSMGPITWVMLSEIFPNKVRSSAMTLAVAVQWLFNGIVAYLFPVVSGSKLNESVFHGSLPYFIFAVLCIVTIAFVAQLVPETKGKTLEEMDEFWDKQLNQ